MKLFGREIAIRRKGCLFNDEPGTELVPSVALYVKVTNACPCACPFCSNAEHAGEDAGFDLQKLLLVIREIKVSGIELSRVCVTGGEPSTAVGRVLPLLDALSGFEFKDVRLQLNTNGISCRRYAEQWAIWIAVDVISIYMWWNRYCMAGENAATLLMWVVFLVNAIYGFIKWEREANRERRI